MSGFTGFMKLKLIEAHDLKPTDYSTRHGVVSSKTIDPYISVDVDEIHIFRSRTVNKTFRPAWNEIVTETLSDASNLTLTVFHDAALSDDVFVANCNISIEELFNGIRNEGKNDIWVSTPCLFQRRF